MLTPYSSGMGARVHDDHAHLAGRVRDRAFCSSDEHDCADCAHAVVGQPVEASANVLINKQAALRVGDRGVHSICCGDNAWVAGAGAPHVLVNNKPALRRGDATVHCGGEGKLVTGSTNVCIGNHAGIKPLPVKHDRTIRVQLRDALGRRLRRATVRAFCPHRTYPAQTVDEDVELYQLCEHATVVVLKTLQHGSWD